MKRLLYVYIFILFSLLTFFFYSGINRINEMKSLGTSDINWYTLSSDSSITIGDVYDNLNSEDSLLTYTKYSTEGRHNYKIYYNDNYDGTKHQATNNYLNFEYYRMDDKATFFNNNGVFGTTLDIDQVTARLGAGEVERSDSIIGYEVFLYLNIGIFSSLVVVTLLINYLLCSYNRKEQAVMVTMGFSEVRILKRLFKSIVVVLVFSILITVFVTSAYLIYKQTFNLLFLRNLVIFDLIVALMFIGLFFLSYNKFKINKAILYLKNFNGLKNGTMMLNIFKVITSFLLFFSLSQITNINQDINENLAYLEKYEELGDYYDFSAGTSNIFKLDNNNSYYQEKYQSFNEFNEEFQENSYYLSFDYYDYLLNRSYGEEAVRAELDVIEQDYNKNYIGVDADFVNDYLQFDNQTTYLDNQIYLLVPSKYRENIEEIKTSYELRMQDDQSFYNGFYNLDLKQDITIQEVIFYDGDLVSQTDMFNTSEYGKIEQDTIFVINANLVKPSISDTPAYLYSFSSFDDFYEAAEKHGLLDLLVPGSKLSSYEEQISDLKLFMMWNQFAILLISLVYFILVINSIIFYIKLNRKTHGIKVLMGYSLFKIFKANLILNSLILLNLIVGLILNYSPLILILCVAVYLFDITLLYVVGRHSIYKSIATALQGGQNEY